MLSFFELELRMWENESAAVLKDILDNTPTRHTAECLAKRLAEMEPSMHKQFPGVAADYGLDVARDAGLKYIQRAREGEVGDLEDGKAWLIHVARRAAIRCLKREVPHISIDFAVPVEWPADCFDEGDCGGVDIGDVLEELSPRQKEAVFLRVLDGLSIRKAARAMGIAPQTLECYLAKAFARLRETVYAVRGKEPAASAGALAVDSRRSS